MPGTLEKRALRMSSSIKAKPNQTQLNALHKIAITADEPYF